MDGHTTRLAHGGLEALSEAEDFRPDLVLLDIGLPKLHGDAVCRRLRKPLRYEILTAVLDALIEKEKRSRSA